MVSPEMLSDSPVKYSVFVGGVLIEMPVIATTVTLTLNVVLNPPCETVISCVPPLVNTPSGLHENPEVKISEEPLL